MSASNNPIFYNLPAWAQEGKAWNLRLFVLILLLCVGVPVSAQVTSGYDEIPVTVNVQGVGISDLPAIIHEELLYLSITDLFDYLKIRNTPSAGMDTISGFFALPQAIYLVDKVHNKIHYLDKTYDLKSDGLIKTETGLYLRSDFYNQIFGLNCTFNFRSLSVNVTTQVELPWIREMRQEQIRSNIRHLKGESRIDTTYRREYVPFHFGAADWSLISGQDVNSGSNLRLNLGLGFILAGGELNLSLNYYSSERLAVKNQFYMWRYVNNEHKALRQLRIGKIFTPSISSVYAPVVGIQVTNTPTTFRKSFGTYTLSNVTKPGWMVELYVNNVLLEYKQAGPSGYYSFEVPLLYGNSLVKLRFYGPWGEEYSREEHINIPFNFVPEKTFEYTASAGMIEDDSMSRFSSLQMNYGLSKRISLGGGVEYLSTVKTGPVLPYLGASVRLASSLMLSADYAHKVRARVSLNYRLPSNLQFELNYTKYQPGQLFINNNYLEERKAVISFPIRTGRLFLFSQLKIHDILLPGTEYTTGEWMISGSIYGVTTNLNTYLSIFSEAEPNLYSSLSLSFRIPGKFMLTPALQYEYLSHELISARCMLEKNILGKGFLNASYEQNLKSGQSSLNLGFRYDLSYSQIGFTAIAGSDKTSFSETIRGSLMYDGKSRYMDVNNRNSVGKGGVVIRPFLDLNCNDHRDPGEPGVQGLKFRITGGRIEERVQDTTIRIFDLEPYTNYLLDLDRTSFDNIAWQLRKSRLNIIITPNRVTSIDVPIAVVGEVSGRVLVQTQDGTKRQGRIIVTVFRQDGIQAARIMTESDGYFDFIGLAPGTYELKLDAGQLKNLKLSATPASRTIVIKMNRDGDVMDNLVFTLKPVTAAIPPNAETGK